MANKLGEEEMSAVTKVLMAPGKVLALEHGEEGKVTLLFVSIVAAASESDCEPILYWVDEWRW